MNKQKKPVIRLDDKAKAHIYDIAEELAVKIKTSDVEKLTSYKKIVNYFL